MPQPLRTVLVTGAASGIGRATAELLAARGFRVLAGTRRRPGVAELPEAPAGCQRVELDVTDVACVAAALQEVQQQCPQGLYALVNNAGIAPPAALELTDDDELRLVLEVNAVAPFRLIKACLPLLRAGRGRIVNISSMNGTVPLPICGGYSASKFALEALTDVFRVELRPWGIDLTVIRPGQIRTAIFDKAGAELEVRSQHIPPELTAGYERLYRRAIWFNNRGARASTLPEAVARKVLKALEARRMKTRYYVGFDAVGLQIAREYLPTRLLDRWLARAMGLMHRVKGPNEPPGGARG